ncbi:hypothetical protein [Dyella sp. 2HG41-7]|uniref:hypothetical protein n=1 Tax=Dyella sp. 2HG41-7 TaxID=2883239 RepID=UPI001F2D3E39|nr:hypothetical protein [Dyella sp. 2HG41-7]
MKLLLIPTTIAVCLACATSISAQDQSHATNLQTYTVTASPGQYETYSIDLSTGYGLKALVGNTHRQFMQAQRAAESSEALRKQGMAPQPFVAIAIDNSIGPGVATRVLLMDHAQNTVAYVDVYCKRAAMADGKHCQLVPGGIRSTISQGLASTHNVKKAHSSASRTLAMRQTPKHHARKHLVA